jgi:RNA ligase (TIGR02306 family)
MASSLIVKVCEIAEKRPHPQADRLEVIRVLGWDVLVQKSLNLQVGQKVIYFPPDSVMSEELAEKLGITKYLSPMRKNSDGTRDPGLRVRAVRLRGEPSYGTIDHEVPDDWEVGKDVAEILGIRKWEPPRGCLDGDAERPHSAFHQYTSLENIRNFPSILEEGEEVIFTEKLHGKNARLGLVLDQNDEGNAEVIFMAGSHEVRRKPMDAKGRPSDFWIPMTEHMRKFLYSLAETYATTRLANVIVFGELINTQKGFHYGVSNGDVGFRVFDISVDGRYLDYDVMAGHCEKSHIEMVPLLYRGPFSWDVLNEHTTGPTVMCDAAKAGTFTGREGIVVKPVKERFSRELPGSGRVALKSISVDYLEYKTGKGKDDVDASDA